jgi:hypothetical protein
MGNKLCMVMVADRETYTYVPHSIWTTRTLALEAARKSAETHKTEWILVEIGLNHIDKGDCIWSSTAESGGDEGKFYLRFWPAGGLPYK